MHPLGKTSPHAQTTALALVRSAHGQLKNKPYAAAHLRSPFGEATHRARPSVQRKSLPPLEQFPLTAFKLVGTLKHGDHIRGIVLAPNHQLYEVRLGMRIGEQSGKVVRVTHEGLEVAINRDLSSSVSSHHKQTVWLSLGGVKK